MDIAVVINGVVDSVYRGYLISDMPDIPGAILVEAEENSVFGGFAYENGSFTAPAETVEQIVPEAISPAQGRIALKRAGLLEQVIALVDASGSNSELEIWWDYATLWERNNANVIALGEALQLTAEQIDDLFRTAAAID